MCLTRTSWQWQSLGTYLSYATYISLKRTLNKTAKKTCVPAGELVIFNPGMAFNVTAPGQKSQCMRVQWG